MKPPFSATEDGAILWHKKPVGQTGVLSYASGDVVATYANVEDWVSVALAPLPGGDIIWEARGKLFGLERKTWADFVSSRNSGHLSDQLRRMLDCFDWVGLCIEVGPGVGRLEDLVALLVTNDLPNITDELQTVLLDWQDLGVRVFFTRDAQHTSEYAHYLCKKYRTRDAQEPLRELSHPGGSKRSLLQAISGVGPKTSTRLTEKHGGTREFWKHYVNYTVNHLRGMDGAIAVKILRAIGRTK